MPVPVADAAKLKGKAADPSKEMQKNAMVHMNLNPGIHIAKTDKEDFIVYAPACGCCKVNAKKFRKCRTHRQEERNKKTIKSEDKKKPDVAKVADKKKPDLNRHADDSEEEHDVVEGAVTPDKICITGPAGVGVMVAIESAGNKDAAPKATKDALKEPMKGILLLGPQDCPQFIAERKIPLDNGKPIYGKYSAGTLVKNRTEKLCFIQMEEIRFPAQYPEFDQKGNAIPIEGTGIDKQLQQKIGAEYRYAGVVDVNKSGLPEFRMLDEMNCAPQDKNALVGCIILVDGIVQFVQTKGLAVGSGDNGAVVGTTKDGIVPAGTVLGELVLDKKIGRLSCVQKGQSAAQNVVATVVQGNYNQPIIVASKDGPLSVGTTCATKDAATYKDPEWQKLVQQDELAQKCSTNDITKSSLAVLSAMLGCTPKEVEEISMRADNDVNRGCLQYINMGAQSMYNIVNETKIDGNPANSSDGMAQKCSTCDVSKITTPSARLGCTSKYVEDTSSNKSETNKGNQQNVNIAPEGISNIANVGTQSKAADVVENPEDEGKSKDGMAQKCSTGDVTKSTAPSAMLGCTSKVEETSSNKSETNKGNQQDIKIAPEGISNIANTGIQTKAAAVTENDAIDEKSSDGMAQKCSTGDVSKSTAPSAMLGCTSKVEEPSSKKESDKGNQQDVKIAPEGISKIANVGTQSKAADVVVAATPTASEEAKKCLSGKSNSLLKSAPASLKSVTAGELKELKGLAGKSTLTEPTGVSGVSPSEGETAPEAKDPGSVAGGKSQPTTKYTVSIKNGGGGASTMGGASAGAAGSVSKQEVISVACYEGANKPNQSKYVTPANKAAALNQTAKMAVQSTYIGNNNGEGRSQWLGGK